MAGNKVLDMVQEILTCSICMEECVDPRQLQCQHIFCCECLQQYIDKKDKKDEIDCPVCRKWCSLPNGKVDELPVSFLYNQLKEAKSLSPGSDNTGDETDKKVELKCSSDDCMNQAIAFCKICKFICPECKADHTTVRSLKSHKIISLDEAVNLEKKVMPSCFKHPSRVLEMYCETCSIPICLMCYPLNHPSHQCVELKEKSEEGRKELETVLRTINLYLDTTDKIEQSVNNHSLKLNAAADAMKQEASKNIERIHQQLKYREEAIQGDVETSHRQAEKKLEAEADKINVIKISLKSLQFYGNQLLLYGTPCDYVAKVSPLKDRLISHNPDDLDINLLDMDATDAQEKIDELKVSGLQYSCCCVAFIVSRMVRSF